VSRGDLHVPPDDDDGDGDGGDGAGGAVDQPVGAAALGLHPL
jgi:hypothetical protein